MSTLDAKLAKTGALLRLLELDFLEVNQRELADKAEQAQRYCDAKDIDNLLLLLKKFRKK